MQSKNRLDWVEVSTFCKSENVSGQTVSTDKGKNSTFLYIMMASDFFVTFTMLFADQDRISRKVTTFISLAYQASNFYHSFYNFRHIEFENEFAKSAVSIFYK